MKISRIRAGLILIISFFLTAPAFCLTDNSQSDSSRPRLEQTKQKLQALRETAKNWIKVGESQYKRGMYQDAEKSFLIARDYQEYLTADEHKDLKKRLAQSHQAVTERQEVLGHIKKAQELLSQGQPIKARAHYEKVRKSPYLIEQERKQIVNELNAVDENFDKRRKEIFELYNRSVEYYRQGNLIKAREGFAEVAKYGMLVAPKEQSAEDYIVQIDNILKDGLDASTADELKNEKPTQIEPIPTPKISSNSDNNEPLIDLATPSNDLNISSSSPEQQAAQKENGSEPNQFRELAEAASVAESAPAEINKENIVSDSKIKIVRTYTKAVIDDAVDKVGYYIGGRDFDKAVAAVRNASQVIEQNRPLIGEELFTEYIFRLKQLTDVIIKARKAS